ncbi:hypothetical protein ACFCV3_03720 [Kribbella sp. NPDC056345]|uniref:hypothetical protein n=1 Tax=Kribbella sp. NPDC056345 TaxID=3345789 RepID=UPI0035E2952F
MPVQQYKNFILNLDLLCHDRRPFSELAALVLEYDPLILRLGNFFKCNVDLLERLPPRTKVVWKLEYFGKDAGLHQIWSSFGSDPSALVRDMNSTGHEIISYAYSDWNRAGLRELVPELQNVPVGTLPLALKPRSAHAVPALEVRTEYDIPHDAIAFGVGGTRQHLKGMEEVVAAFAETATEDQFLLCTVLGQGGETAADVYASWRRRMPGRGLDRVRVRVGKRDEWDWMCGFYAAVDLVLVNSELDSWGRMVAEPLSLGTPVVVRESTSGTNQILDSLVRVRSFSDFGGEEFLDAAERARQSAASLAEQSWQRYSPDLVRRHFAALVSEWLDDSQKAQMEEFLGMEEWRRELDLIFQSRSPGVLPGPGAPSWAK